MTLDRTAHTLRAAGIPISLGLIAGLTVHVGMALAADPFIVTSPAYKDGDIWPSKFAGADPARTNPPCPGQNVSPPLVWSNAPEKTKTFAIVMFDPDGGNGTGSNHWVAYDIPKTKISLTEGEASVSPKEWLGGKNNANNDHYFGPCGPAGHSLHHYVITVLSTDIDHGALKPGLTREELLAALRGHSLAASSIVGRYTRPTP